MDTSNDIKRTNEKKVRLDTTIIEGFVVGIWTISCLFFLCCWCGVYLMANNLQHLSCYIYFVRQEMHCWISFMKQWNMFEFSIISSTQFGPSNIPCTSGQYQLHFVPRLLFSILLIGYDIPVLFPISQEQHEYFVICKLRFNPIARSHNNYILFNFLIILRTHTIKYFPQILHYLFQFKFYPSCLILGILLSVIIRYIKS